uniref:Cyclin C-terminal domain-containing protein n=1 Tax=Esox lucius TaxID=8010 RepID=A0AAY5KHU7_ESOLU
MVERTAGCGYPSVPPYQGVEAPCVPCPLTSDGDASVLCRPAGHPVQPLPAVSHGEAPGRLPPGPVHGPLRRGRQTALRHRPVLPAPRQRKERKLFLCRPSGKFEEKEDRVPKLDQLNSLGFMCSLNLVLNKRDLIKMELLLLETFGWNLCMPTPAHFIDYYLHASVQDGDLYNGWPLSSLSKTKAFMDKYTHYFLEVSLQDHAFLSFRPSQVAAACVAASRICLQISPSWTTSLHLLTGYTWEHLTQCIELMLLAHDNDVKEANKPKSVSPLSRASSLQSQPSHLSPVPAVQRPASTSSSTTSTPQQLLFQPGPGGFPHLSQHSPSLSHLQALAESQALGPAVVNMSQDFLQSHRMGLLAGATAMTPTAGAFPSYPSMASGLQPGGRVAPLALQGPISMQVALAAEPRHCLSMAYSGGYLGGPHHHHGFTAASCFDR